MTVTINSLTELAQFQDTSGSDELAFRGQGEAGWALVPSLYRGMESLDITDSESMIGDRERDIFREFSDRSRLLSPGGTPWDKLGKAQHHGAPTRLLDWTPNAQAALYFACAASPSSDGALWCANPSKIPLPDYLGRLHKGLGLRKERLSRYISEQELPFCMPFSRPVPAFGTPTAPAPAKPAFDQSGNPDLSGILTFFLPEHFDDRVAAQTGLFSVYISGPSDEIVVDHEAYLRSVEKEFNTKILEKLVIPAPRKKEILLSLHRAGVDAASIYPDLQGLGLYLSSWQRDLIEDLQ